MRIREDVVNGRGGRAETEWRASNALEVKQRQAKGKHIKVNKKGRKQSRRKRETVEKERDKRDERKK